ncbi:hypothetical protein MJO28_000842 [Puccinia striiformis f. sp. tritici]|uniref:Uncharacterized protein n=1 Tax=Puccinia striiformis f. sp. tritici TaxID=168172 RepID=A0ACC0F0S4_9BASI|nr:hypothetical protein MJO28_000842 [Puccinia striiformis f. sp. tritici]
MEQPRSPQIPTSFYNCTYDTANEFENRQLHGQDLSPLLMQRIQSILHRPHPLIQQFECVASEIILNRSIRLTDNATNVDQRVYNLPTGDQIAAIWVEEVMILQQQRPGMLSSNIMMEICPEFLISELDQKYDPLYYVL